MENWKKRGRRGQRWSLRRGSAPLGICPCKLTESPALQGLSSKNEARELGTGCMPFQLSTPASNQKWEVEVGIRAALLNFKVWLKRKTETAIWMIQVQNFRPTPPTLKKKVGVSGGEGRREKGVQGSRGD